MKRVVIFTVLWLLFAGMTHAQWKSEVSLGSSFYRGNVDKLNIRATGSLSHADSLFEYATNAEATYSQTSGKTDNQLLQGNIKFDYRPYGTVSPFTLVSVYNNEPKKIKLRLSGLVGAKYTFINKVNDQQKDVADYSISAAVQVDKEQYMNDKKDTEKVRLSVRPKIEHQLNAHVSFKHVTFYVPKINEFSDYMIDSRTTLKSALNKNVSMEITYKIEHISVLPDQELENTDHALIASFVLSL